MKVSRFEMFESTCLEEWFYGRGKPDWVSRLSRQQELVCTWWIIPLSKWVITPVINGISRVNPLITGVITHLLSGMNHQVWLVGESGKDKQLSFVRLERQPSGVGWNLVFRASWFVHDGGRKVLKEKYIWYIYIFTCIYIYRVCIYIIYIIVNRVLVPRPQDPLGPAGWVSLLSFLGFIKLKPSSACPAQPWEPSEPAKSWGLEDYHDYFSLKIIGFHDG